MTFLPGSTASMGVGAPTTLANGSTYYQLNGSGQVVAVWLGASGAPTKIMDILTGGAITPLGAWSNLTAYSANAVVNSGGSSYIAVSPSTGIDPTTDDGTHWMLLAARGAAGPTGPTGSPTTDQSILLRHIADFARDPELMNGGGAAGTPTGPHVAQSMRRTDAATTFPLTSGTLHLTAVAVPGGRALTGGSVKHGVAMSGGTHAWLGLWDFTTGAQLALSADDTSATATASARRDYTFATPYTPATGRLLLAGFLQIATTPGNLTGRSQANAAAETPNLASNHGTTGLTTPPATAVPTGAKPPYWVSLF